MRCLLSTCALLLGAFALAGTAHAQPLPAPLAWERVGPTAHTQYDSTAVTYGLTFVHDTLVVSTSRQEMLCLDPATERWAPWRVRYGTPGGASGELRTLLLTADEAALEPGAEAGTPVVFFDPGGLFRAGPTDALWQGVLGGSVDPLPVRGPGGALFSGTNRYGNGDSSIVRSNDGGRTWQALTGYTGVYTYALAYAETVPEPVGGVQPAGGALVSADAFGLAYAHGGVSASGEVAWQNVSGLTVLAYSVAAVQTGPRDGGKAGRFLATAYDGSDSRMVASDDGGATWAPVFNPPPLGAGLYLTAAPDGAVYAYYQGYDIARHLYGSADGGQTWTDLGLVGPAPEIKFGIDQLVVGPDGRLYAGGHDGTPGYNPDEDEVVGGVWRTVEPVVSVAAEPPAPTAPRGFGVRAFPNPASGRVTVEVSGLAPGAPLRARVFDAQGRLVRALHDGPARGARFTFDASGLAPGPYVVRVEAGGASASAPLTIVR